MAYDPTVWKSGDTITSAKLNKLENGLAEASGGGTGGGALIVNDVNGTLDKTWKEIHDNPSAVIKADVGHQTTVFHIAVIAEEEGSYALVAFSYDMNNILSEVYVTHSIDGYPVKSS